uniref:Glycosyltransferase like family 2 n=1 Tax=Candidatus Kentrum sp. DK TaxID=2126562 RepID=A0A450T204_9GAMM|nr:MAG: Glycosyltransferase like family 2 [Candidatus Kentron sp. DK]
MLEKSEFIAQKLLAPDPYINSEGALFYHCAGNSGYDSVRRHYYVEKGGKLVFDSYFNCFPLHLYDLTDEHSLEVRIKAKGKSIFSAGQAHWQKSGDMLIETHIDFSNEDEQLSVPIPLMEESGVIFLEFTAREPLEIYDVEFVIIGPRRREVSVCAVITTYKRDREVQNTAKRLEAYFSRNADIAPLFRLIVVDNGGETDTVPFSAARVIKNPNYGGAGGFMRGLLETIDDGRASHALFMDDDASFFPENIRRTLAVLSFSKHSNLAISGAMITKLHKWMMWEDTATFRGGCRPLHTGRDLRHFMEVMTCAFDKPFMSPSRYGGWWYFCFPIAEAKTLTFPFFVRGDDIYFSLANNFQIIAIPGVVSIQEDFSEKQSPLTLYLDMRNHIVQNLTFLNGKKSARADLKMMRSFFWRYNTAYHYETAAAINLAIEDVMKGATFWEENLDMAQKRAEIAKLMAQEKIKTPLPYDPNYVFAPRPIRRPRLMGFLRKATFNGHLLPGFFFYKKGRILSLSDRAIGPQLFRRPFAIHIDQSNGAGYQVEINRRKFFKNWLKFCRLTWAYKLRYGRLLNAYSEFKQKRTSSGFWQQRFGMQITSADK